ncbi:hypothetical protein ACFJGW_19775 [Burkholderiaceae bacterium UC74_6]
MQEAQRTEVPPQAQGLFVRWRDALLQRGHASEAGEGELGFESALPWLIPEESPPAQS